jgi:hypothetical protein
MWRTVGSIPTEPLAKFGSQLAHGQLCQPIGANDHQHRGCPLDSSSEILSEKVKEQYKYAKNYYT